VSLEGLSGGPVADRSGSSVRVPAATTHARLAAFPDAEHLALHNLPSLPHISVGGAIATATHGSGDRNGNLATAVEALDLVASDGTLMTISPNGPDFEGAVVGLGALGAVTTVTLAVEPAYDVRQLVFERLAWRALCEHFDEIMASGESVSVFTRWTDVASQVWVKRRTDGAVSDLFGAEPATQQLHGAARASGPLAGPPPALPRRLHAQQR
jgi:xylitol oxidase